MRSVDTLKVGQHEDVEQFGAGSGTQGRPGVDVVGARVHRGASPEITARRGLTSREGYSDQATGDCCVTAIVIQALAIDETSTNPRRATQLPS